MKSKPASKRISVRRLRHEDLGTCTIVVPASRGAAKDVAARLTARVTDLHWVELEARGGEIFTSAPVKTVKRILGVK